MIGAKSDKSLQDDVMNELKWDPSVTNSDLSVTANEGVITLRGTVPHYYEKSTAEDAVQRVSGVRAVADEIEVSILGSYERGDSEIASAAVLALDWSYSVPKGIQITVDKGWIILKGETEWEFERAAAKHAVSHLMGVRGVSNDITLKSNVKPFDIKSRVEAALKRTAEADSKNIRVSVEGSKVTLAGTVHSFSEIEDARIAAWNAPGVMQVVNDLKISN